MEKGIKISAENLTKEIASYLRKEIVAVYTVEENAILVHFVNGKNFRVSVEEIEETAIETHHEE